jgi:gamma-glutamylputrescine oxidase
MMKFATAKTTAISAEALNAYPPTYYAATCHLSPAPASLESDVQADVCIIGGGYTGLAAALRLAELGTSVRLLESGQIAWGASGRNGGQVHTGMRMDQIWLEANLGEKAARDLWKIGLDARTHLDQLMHDYAIDCDFRPGQIYANHKLANVATSHAGVRHLQDRYGYTAIRTVGKDEMRSLVACDTYHGGSLDMGGGHLHPLKLALGMAHAAEKAGAILHTMTRATSVTKSGSGWRVATEHGTVTAGKVLIAGGGYVKGLNASTDARVLPINNFIATTEPLGKERATSLIANQYSVSDSRFVVYYFRMTPDHRLLFGGGENYSYTAPNDIAAFVRPHIETIFPQLRGIGIDHAWGGTLAITRTRMPFVREVEPGLFNISGYSGHGVLLAPYFGRILAEAMAGGNADALRILTQIPIKAFPGGPMLRWPTLVAAMTFFSVRDRIGF